MLPPLSISSAFLVYPDLFSVLFCFAPICFTFVVSSLSHPDVALGHFGLAVTLGVAFAAIFCHSVLVFLLLHGGSCPLFYFFNFFLCPLVL